MLPNEIISKIIKQQGLSCTIILSLTEKSLEVYREVAKKHLPYKYEINNEC